MSENIIALYDDKIATPLKRITQNTPLLLSQLAALPDADKEQLKTAIAEAVNTRTNQEAFVPSDALATFPALFRHMQALEGFFQILKKEKQATLTPLEIAAATQHWESYDQFTQTAATISDAVTKLYSAQSPLAKQAKAIVDDSEALAEPLGGREKDAVFLHALTAVQSVEPANQAPAVQIYNTHIKAPLAMALAALDELQHSIQGLEEPDKQQISTLIPAYEKQCGGESSDLLASLDSYSSGIRQLQSAMRKISAEPKTEPLTVGEEMTASDPGGAFRLLRNPIRALHEVLNATNHAGKYDALLQQTATIGSHCWEVQKAMDGPLAAKFSEAVATYKSALPSSVVTDAMAQPVMLPPIQSIS